MSKRYISEMFDNEYEACVACGILTDILKITDVTLRHNYVEGAGQLCLECSPKPRHTRFSIEDI